MYNEIVLIIAIAIIFYPIMLITENLITQYIGLKIIANRSKAADTDVFVKVHFKKSFLGGIISYVLSALFLPILLSIISGEFEGFSFSLMLAYLPEYNSAESILTVCILIIVSIIIFLLYSYFITLKHCKFTKKQRLLFSLILAVITAPYAFLVSLSSFA